MVGKSTPTLRRVHLKHHSVYSEARCRTHCLLDMVSHLYVIRTGKDIEVCKASHIGHPLLMA